MSNLTITKDAEKDQKFDKPVRWSVLCFTFHGKMLSQFIGAHISGIKESAIEHNYSK